MIEKEIQRLARHRQELWSRGDPLGEVPSLTKKLEALYDERRRNAVLSQHGDPVKIVKRARIESEIERLMSR